MCRKPLTKTEGLIRNEEGEGGEEETPLNQRKK